MAELLSDKKIYFLSDFHLGAPDYERSLIREKKIIRFLNHIQKDAAEIFILGDMFDFWYEYKKAVPKNFVRLLGKLGELTDSGIIIHFFVGNHDMWMKDYFEKELQIKTYHHPDTFTYNDKKFYIAHGDGLGPGDKGYKFLKKIFRSRFCNWLFGRLHPDSGIALANYFSRKSREKTGAADAAWLGEENEWLAIYSKQQLAAMHYDYFIYGHRHFPIDLPLTGINNGAASGSANEGKASRYINLGDWITHFTYAVFDGTDITLKKWEEV
ncbi:MAG TPA: UDP-2,3-diacylglucosamine diphosphatase [Arachidicoccus sp.]|nr:UDP-2,3-diacylglucosamine diphosphatase [Arachidicoccus sp.]